MLATWGAADTNSDNELDLAEWKQFVDMMGSNSEAANGWKPAYDEDFINSAYETIKLGCPDATGITQACFMEYLGVAQELAAAAKAQ